MKTVYVGLSGGVDSSVAAALLQQRGYRVVGVYMKNWTREIAGLECPWKADLADARGVAAKLDIPFKVFDFEDEYFKHVARYLIAGYQKGETPNPDVVCNEQIKFKLFLDTALADGADLIATGHYARIADGQLHAGIDAAKDQSYFLARVNPEVWHQVLLPIGALTKPEVRCLAAQLSLPTAQKPDSQGICFIGEVPLKQFLQQYVQAVPGPIIDSTGAQIGTHDGAIFYTIGQRHGLGIGGGQPYFVISKNISKNELYVTTNEADLAADRFELTDPQWTEAKSNNLTVRIRYRAKPIPCQVNGRAIQLTKPDRAITPGQLAVFYATDRVAGSGFISLVPKVASIPA